MDHSKIKLPRTSDKGFIMQTSMIIIYKEK